MSKPHAESWERAFAGSDPKGEPTTESGLQQRVVNHMKRRYPTVRFESHLGGEKFGTRQATRVKAMNSHNGYPDFHIIKKTEKYSGLFLELKKDGVTVYKKDGTLRKDPHLESQDAYHKYLVSEGYQAQFVIGYAAAIEVIDEYLKDIGQQKLW